MLTPGARLGVYEILGPLGRGGMGEVYRARDTRLARDVAIKVLPEKSSGDDDAIARLQLEARAASALNHPNILTIYEVSPQYIAMELIDGETLRQRLTSKNDDSLIDILVQVADGLAKAHEANVVHRDLKPENIMVTADGYAKILDFGLAKPVQGAMTASDPNDTTARMPVSEVGRIVGTVGYMSPEQISGSPVDARADIFAFGCILYEAVSGQRAFQNLMEIITIEPQPLRIAGLQRVAAKCLAKDPARRYSTMRDVSKDLRRFRTRDRASQPMPRPTQITFDRVVEQCPAISPDGSRVVFSREVGKVRNLFLTMPSEGSEERLTESEMDDMQPSFSPDGRSLLFVRGRERGVRLDPAVVFGRYVGGDVWRLDLETNRPSLVIGDASNPSFSPDASRIAFDAARGGPHRIWLADARGRNVEQLTTDATEAVHHLRPRWSPDGRCIVFQRYEGTKFDIRVVNVETKHVHAVTDDYTMDLHPVWSADGEWIFFSSYRSGGINVWRMPVDIDGVPVGPMEQISAGPGHDVDLDISRTGRLVFAILKQNADIWRLPVDPLTGSCTGEPQPVVSTTRENSRGAWSPDGKSIAFSSDRAGEMNLWLYTFEGSRTRQITRGAGSDFQPNWSADGRSLVFFSGRGGSLDIWRVDLESPEPVRLTHGEGININPFFSPEGTRVAFMSDRDGRLEVWVMNRDGSDVRQLTTIGAGGHFLRWDGERIIFRCPTPPYSATMTVSVDGGDPQRLAEVKGGAHMSLSPDGTMIMDVVAHRTLWVSPLNGGEPRRVFEFEDPESRIDYPVWSPDGRSIMFDRFVPHGGNIWSAEVSS